MASRSISTLDGCTAHLVQTARPTRLWSPSPYKDRNSYEVPRSQKASATVDALALLVANCGEGGAAAEVVAARSGSLMASL